MARGIQEAKTVRGERFAPARVSCERCPLKTFLIIAAFVAMAVAPAFAALNVFTEKNRL
jgi:hypothetical protein